MIAITLIIAIGLLAVAWFVFCIRNERVYRVRIAFIDDAPLYKSGAYDRLPSYDDMLYSPRYWHLWTKQQWIEVVK